MTESFITANVVSPSREVIRKRKMLNDKRRTQRGSRLEMHLDYSIHPVSGKERRVNLIVYMNRSLAISAFERIWHVSDSQGQILALAFWLKTLKCCRLFPFGLEAGLLDPPSFREGAPRQFDRLHEQVS